MLHHKTYKHSTSTEWVTFIHGAGGSSNIWYRQLSAFKKVYNVLLIDLRGHGESKHLSLENMKKYTFRFITEEVKQVLDHLKIAKSHFVGISLGTIVIRELAEICPERIDKMIMGGAILKMNFRSQILMNIGFWLKSFIPYMLLYKLIAWILMPRKSHRKSRNIFVQEAKKLYQKEFIRWYGLAKSVNPLLRIFRSIDPGIPTLYIMGDEDYMFLPAVKEIIKHHLSATLNVIEDCGHVVNIDKPKVFNKVALDFLRV